ncbi:succinate dehydrogenase [ubiquinone] iron-sulfur subunit-like [Pararge aegeria]|uniref:Succinate dehydrogenase [ubiquinone] iron-sulfur subunit, mitochondrial n=1 Tax=Pararge aegeria aegeria TaxID=348720 RepID=A0A8S4RQS4_9NEOP|nr:succinate dehydrogenase [ubiquinone] iron-sulfur subunit-like [Pararge aegeria]CAH2239813.1 jg14083 [Pararge aegeria aegeria]
MQKPLSLFSFSKSKHHGTILCAVLRQPYSGHKPATTESKKPVDPRRIFKVYRFGGVSSNEKPQVMNYDLDVSTCGRMVLDALIKLKDMDPTLVFRRSCREGICGSCAVNLQGHNCLACITAIPQDKTINIYPIPHMYVIRDLVVDMTHFFDVYNSLRPYLIRRDSGSLGKFQYAQSISDNAKLVGLYECVLCSCCSTACPSYWWNGRRFYGPASLLHAYRWIIDSRDEDTEQRLFELRDDFKAFRCHTIINCTLACPKGLHPALIIAKLKRLISGLDKKEPPEIDTMKFSSSGPSCGC